MKFLKNLFSPKEIKEDVPELSEIDKLKGENKLYFNYLMSRFGAGQKSIDIPGAPSVINEGNHTISKSGERLSFFYVQPGSQFKSTIHCTLEPQNDQLVYSFYRTFNHYFESRGLTKRQQCAHEYPDLDRMNDSNNLNSVESMNYFLGRMVQEYVWKVVLAEEKGGDQIKGRILKDIYKNDIGMKNVF